MSSSGQAKDPLSSIANIQSIQNTSDFIWNVGGEQLRHISKFWIGDSEGLIRHLEDAVEDLQQNTSPSDWIIVGDLLPQPGSDAKVVRVKTTIKEVMFNFGKSQSDPNRGLWIKNNLFWILLKE